MEEEGDAVQCQDGRTSAGGGGRPSLLQVLKNPKRKNGPPEMLGS